MGAMLYKAGGSTKTVYPAGKTFNLDELQSFVGGYIEIIYLNDNELMVVNEEGKINDLPVNVNATEIFWKHLNTSDYICGDALVCEQKMIE